MLAKTVSRTAIPESDLFEQSAKPTGKRGRAKPEPEVAPPEPETTDPADLAGPIETESARHKFERLCVARMNRALTSIRLLGNLASSNYRWDEPDVEAIQRALVAAVSDTMTKFEKRKKVKPTFTLPPAGAAPATWHGKPEPDAET